MWLLHVTMTLRRVYSVPRSSNITHNTAPAIFEDDVGAHERSQIQFGHEAIHAITRRSFTTGRNCPGSSTVRGVSACSIIPNPRRRMMYIHTRGILPVESHAYRQVIECSVHGDFHHLDINSGASLKQYLFLRTQQCACCGHTWFKV